MSMPFSSPVAVEPDEGFAGCLFSLEALDERFEAVGAAGSSVHEQMNEFSRDASEPEMNDFHARWWPAERAWD